MDVTQLVQQVYDRAVELENDSDNRNNPYKLYFLCDEEWESWEDYCRFERESDKMRLAIAAKSLDAAACLICLTQNHINKHNTVDKWEYYFGNFKEGDKLEDYIKNKYSGIREEPINAEFYSNTFEDFEKTKIYKRRKESIEIYDINKVGELYS